MRIALAGLMIVHGFAHIVGFMVPWQLVDAPEIQNRTAILGGSLEVGAAGIRVVTRGRPLTTEDLISCLQLR